MYTTGRRSLAIQYAANGATTRVTIYIYHWKMTGNSIIWDYSRKILHCAPPACLENSYLLYALHSHCGISSRYDSAYVCAKMCPRVRASV